MKKLSCIIIGAGNRGRHYADEMIKQEGRFEVIGVADPNENRREFMKETYKIKDENCFTSWEQVFEKPKFADFVVISTQDEMHYNPAMKAIELGYDILLEKPIAPTPEECKKITEAAEKKGVKVLVCHVLRYTPAFGEIKRIILSGEIGEVQSVESLESVGIRHMSHSFVRGEWRNKELSAPMILAKSCHDTDLIAWLIGKDCKKVQSFGSLKYFKKENKPEGSPERCIEGCPYGEECIFNTAKLYQGKDAWGDNWFRGVATQKVNPTEEDVEKAMRESKYGRCVFSCDNNVVDHEVVNMEFEEGVTATLTMTAFTKDGWGREMRIFGTKGMIEIFGSNGTVDVTIFGQRNKEYWGDRVSRKIDVSRLEDKDGIGITSGHGGGDAGIVNALYYDFNNAYEGFRISSVRQSYLSHLISFAAEESRLTDKVIKIDGYDKDLK